MARLTVDERIIRQIIKTHGSVIDLKANPDLFIEIVRKHGADILGRQDVPDDGGGLPGGVGPVGPTSHQAGPGIEDVLKEVLKVQRQLAKVTKQLGP
ncbi:MAG: hypothetical protein LC733_09610 [Actinobacteria bacterium]|nr:hypothetical protein [Actinomycetota bacterium]